MTHIDVRSQVHTVRAVGLVDRCDCGDGLGIQLRLDATYCFTNGIGIASLLSQQRAAVRHWRHRCEESASLLDRVRVSGSIQSVPDRRGVAHRSTHRKSSLLVLFLDLAHSTEIEDWSGSRSMQQVRGRARSVQWGARVERCAACMEGERYRSDRVPRTWDAGRFAIIEAFCRVECRWRLRANRVSRNVVLQKRPANSFEQVICPGVGQRKNLTRQTGCYAGSIAEPQTGRVRLALGTVTEDHRSVRRCTSPGAILTVTVAAKSSSPSDVDDALDSTVKRTPPTDPVGRVILLWC